MVIIKNNPLGPFFSTEILRYPAATYVATWQVLEANWGGVLVTKKHNAGKEVGPVGPGFVDSSSMGTLVGVWLIGMGFIWINDDWWYLLIYFMGFLRE